MFGAFSTKRYERPVRSCRRMNRAACCALALVALLAVQATMAFQIPPPLSVRDQNRQILVAAEGPTYNPLAPTTVVRGEMDAATTQTMALSEAIERHLDFLDQFGIRLADGPPAVASELPPHQRPPPSGPLFGTFEFRENGWRSEGARCPTVTPGWPQEVRDAMRDRLPPAEYDRIGLLETDVSEFHTSSATGFKLNSSLTYWGLGDDPVDDPVIGYWEYGAGRGEGWSFQAAFAIDDLQVTVSTFFCREGERVSHHSMVWPYAERTDRPEGQA